MAAAKPLQEGDRSRFLAAVAQSLNGITILGDGFVSSRARRRRNASSSRCARSTEDGTTKPTKRKSVGRIDGLVALAMAIGVAPLQVKPIEVEALIA